MMRNINLDWGVGIFYFHCFYTVLLNAYGQGVSLSGNCISIDNGGITGTIEFCFLNNKISLVRFELSCSEAICFTRSIHTDPDYYVCVFYFKEGINPRVFGDAGQQETELSRMFGDGYAQYFSADAPTHLKLASNNQIRGAIVVFTSDALTSALPLNQMNESCHLFDGRTTNGFVQMQDSMADKLAALLTSHNRSFQSMYLLGGIYMLLSILIKQIESK